MPTSNSAWPPRAAPPWLRPRPDQGFPAGRPGHQSLRWPCMGSEGAESRPTHSTAKVPPGSCPAALCIPAARCGRWGHGLRIAHHCRLPEQRPGRRAVSSRPGGRGAGCGGAAHPGTRQRRRKPGSWHSTVPRRSLPPAGTCSPPRPSRPSAAGSTPRRRGWPGCRHSRILRAALRNAGEAELVAT